MDNQQPKHNDKDKPFDPIAELVVSDLAKLSQEQRDISYIYTIYALFALGIFGLVPAVGGWRHYGLCQTQRTARHDLFRPSPVFAKNLLDHTDFRHYRLLHLDFPDWFPDSATNFWMVYLPRRVRLFAPA